MSPMDTLASNLGSTGLPVWMVVGTLWSIPWKGVALWKASRLSHKKWFIIILVASTFGILEMFYIYFVANKYTVEVVEE